MKNLLTMGTVAFAVSFLSITATASESNQTMKACLHINGYTVEQFDTSNAPENEILIILTWTMPFGQTVYWIPEIPDSLKSWFSLFCAVSHLSNCIHSLADSFNSGPPEI